jgi:hypothetical protein
MLMEFLIEARASQHQSKWRDFIKQKNNLFALFVVEKDEIVSENFLENSMELDHVVVSVCLDLCAEKLFLLGHISKKDYEVMTGRKAVDAEEWLKKDREGFKDVKNI